MSTSKKLALAAFTSAATFLVPLAAFAQGRQGGLQHVRRPRLGAVGAGLAIGLAVLGGALGQGRAAAAALEGISRNPGASARIQTPMILGLALIESLVLIAIRHRVLAPQRRRRLSRRAPRPRSSPERAGHRVSTANGRGNANARSRSASGAVYRTRTTVAGVAGVGRTADHPSGSRGSVKPKSQRESTGERFTQPWLCTRPKSPCQYVP